jgi:hypothetical protein
MSGCRSESSIPRNQRGSEVFGKHNVRSIVSRKIMTQLPNPGQELEMSIPSDAEIQQITDRLVSTVYGNHTLVYETA